MPVQVILGANDAMLKSAETRERLRRLVSQAEITWLPDAGHMLPPQTARVADFLNTARQARASSSAETGAVSSNVAFQLASQSDVQV
jgi:pimeloyl-ACP methyl ester carboxylesterase